VVVEDRGEIEPPPAHDLEIGEVGLPELVGPGGLVLELVRGTDHDMRRRGDEVLGLEDAVRRGFRDEVSLLVGVLDRQLPRREVFVLERELHDVPANLVRDAVPDRPGSWGLVGQSIEATLDPTGVPVVVGAARDPEHGQRALHRQM
jgi:hypothetical protein